MPASSCAPLDTFIANHVTRVRKTAQPERPTIWLERQDRKAHAHRFAIRTTRLIKQALAVAIAKLVSDLAFLLSRCGRTPKKEKKLDQGGPFPGDQIPALLRHSDLLRWFEFKWRDLLSSLGKYAVSRTRFFRETLKAEVQHLVLHVAVMSYTSRRTPHDPIVIRHRLQPGRNLCVWTKDLPLLHRLGVCPAHHAQAGDVVRNDSDLFVVTAGGLGFLGDMKTGDSKNRKVQRYQLLQALLRVVMSSHLVVADSPALSPPQSPSPPSSPALTTTPPSSPSGASSVMTTPSPPPRREMTGTKKKKKTTRRRGGHRWEDLRFLTTLEALTHEQPSVLDLELLRLMPPPRPSVFFSVGFSCFVARLFRECYNETPLPRCEFIQSLRQRGPGEMLRLLLQMQQNRVFIPLVDFETKFKPMVVEWLRGCPAQRSEFEVFPKALQLSPEYVIKNTIKF